MGKLSRAVLRGEGYGDVFPLIRQDTVGEFIREKLKLMSASRMRESYEA